MPNLIGKGIEERERGAKVLEKRTCCTLDIQVEMAGSRLDILRFDKPLLGLRWPSSYFNWADIVGAVGSGRVLETTQKELGWNGVIASEEAPERSDCRILRSDDCTRI